MTQPHRLSIFVFAALFAAPFARAQDPFSAHTRWTYAAATSEPWLPSNLAFAAGGELLWSSAQGVSPRAMLFSTAPVLGTASHPPLREDLQPGASSTIGVAVGDDERELFTISQYATFDSAHRRTEVAKYDARAPGGFAPLWDRTLGLIGNGAAKLGASRDGTTLVAATHDASFQVLGLEWLDGNTGALTATHASYAGTLRQMAVSADAQRAALIVGGELRVYDANAALEHVEILPTSSNALAMSGDGTRIVVGFGANVRELVESNGLWSVVHDWSGNPGEIATRVALSDQGDVLAIGWWNSVSTHSVRFEVRDLMNLQLRYERLLDAPASSLQNFVEAVSITRDGRRAAFGCWGTGDSDPEVVLVDTSSGQEALALDLGGSVRALALDASGTRVAVGFKHAHANQFASTGELRSFDTGERRVQVVNEPLAGQTLRIAARQPGATRVLFYVGTRLNAPLPFPGGGEWWIHRKSATRSIRLADATGRADLLLGLSAASAGTSWSIQAVARSPLGLRLLGPPVDPVIF